MDSKNVGFGCLGLVLLLLAGCGGGGGDDGGEPPSEQPPPGGGGDDGGDTPEQPPPDLNGGLTGKLYFDQPEDYVEFDLETSVRTVIRSGVENATPAADASEFVVTTQPLSESLDTEDLLVLDRDGTTKVRIEREEFFGGVPKLSPDGSRIVVGWDFLDKPAVFDRSGNLLAQLGEDFRDWDWAPDGRLLLAKGDSIFIVDAALTDVQLLKQFPGDAPDFLSVSPDGRQLAFDLGDADLLENHVFVMNLDGSGLRQLTTSGLNEDGATWSPDGAWIIVRQGITYTLGGTPGAGCPELWAVPADAETATLGSTPTGGAFQLKEIEDGEQRNVCAFTPPEWRASPEPLPTVAGSAPSGGGLNSGLGGRLFYDGFVDGDAAFVDLRLEDGAAAALPLPAHLDSIDVSDPWVDRDATELTYLQSEADSGNPDYDQITLQQLDGTVTDRFEVLDFPHGQPKLSPDGQRVAVEWHSIDLGDDGGVPVVTIFDRSGNIQRRWEGADGWDWLPDGRLVLSARNQLYVTNATLDQAQLIAELGDDIEGIVADPAGSRLAFAMAGHAWTLNLDGSGLRRLTRARQAVSAPAWSPDGRYLAVLLDDQCPQAYAVPADGERVPVGEPLLSSSSLLLRRMENGDARDVCVFSSMSWR